MQGHSTMDVREHEYVHDWTSMVYGYQSSIIHDFIDIHLDIH